MIRYIPSFILHQYEQKALSGEITAFVVQFDIVDFTESCAVLFTRPKGGVETLSSYLDAAFHIPIETLSRFGGFVAGFSGDACSVIIPSAKPEEVLTAIRIILRHFTEVTQVEDLPLRIRLNVTYGSVQWIIFENEHQNEYIFAGEAFEDSIQMQNMRLPVAFSKKAAEQIGLDGFLNAGEGYEPKRQALDAARASGRHIEYSFKASTRAKFCDSHFNNCKPTEEYQPAGYCFISLNGIAEPDLPSAIREIDRQAHKYKGLVNKLEKSDKGFLAIVLFGIPKKDGEIYGDLCKFSLKLIKYLPKARIGLSIGYVLACFTGSGLAKEYTAFGHPMNLAARFMTIAKPGEIIVDEYLRELEDTQFHFTDLGSVPLKGMEKQNKTVKYHSLSRAVAHRDMYSRREFVGRREEQDRLKETLVQSITERTNRIIYVHG
ncbi:MAG TPA: adenylate/guanylate cyclase domain-containing protein, partial [Candidatus Cloacimonadota bacterium]|nr:adenylate/guanylate cyclase domain-containing protein [Candidatus Cloacimonadota bacterium]